MLSVIGNSHETGHIGVLYNIIIIFRALYFQAIISVCISRDIQKIWLESIVRRKIIILLQYYRVRGSFRDIC